MIVPEVIAQIKELCNKPVALGGWLGLPYDLDKGCYKFVVMMYQELGITLDPYNQLRAFRDFSYVEKPEFGDVVVFYYTTITSWHVGVMVDHRRMIQSGQCSNGVGITPIDVYPWPEMFKGFLRHKSLLCS